MMEEQFVVSKYCHDLINKGFRDRDQILQKMDEIRTIKMMNWSGSFD